MIEEYSVVFNIVAGFILFAAQSIYIFQVVKKQITPSLLSWLGWSILVSVALISQFVEYGWNWTLLGHLVSAMGCLFIFLFAFLSNNFIILSKDWRFLYFGIACIVLYVLSSDMWLTTIFALLADVILGIPTLIKAVKFPKTEKTLGWNIAMGCWTLTLITCWSNNVIFVLYPIYCLLFNGIMSYLTRSKRILSMEDVLVPAPKKRRWGRVR